MTAPTLRDAGESPSAEPPSRRRRILLASGLLLVTLIAYGPALFSGTIWDDSDHVMANPSLSGLGGLLRIWSTTDCPQYYPVTFTSFWIERQLWGLSPIGYHVTNVVLHALCALLFARILCSLGIRGAWLAGAIFALHPVHVESVAWISERKNVLSTLFYLLATERFFAFEENRRRRDYLLSILLFAAALLSKSVTCTLPLALLVIRWARGKSLDRRYVRGLVPLFAMGLAIAPITLWVERHRAGAMGSDFGLTAVDRILVAGRALWFYATKIFVPTGLTTIYPRFAIDSSSLVQYLPPAGALAILVAAWLLRQRVGRWVFASVAFFAFTLAPGLGFFDVSFMRYSFVADHFQYLASLGPIALVAALATTGVEEWRRRAAAHSADIARLARVIAVAILALLGVLVFRQSRLYHDEETLWRGALAQNPSAWVSHYNLGVRLLEKGNADEALEHLSAAVKLERNAPDAWINLGNALVVHGRLDEAIDAGRRACSLAPKMALAHFSLGFTFAEARRFPEAIASYRRGLDLAPDDLDARLELAKALDASGDHASALDAALEARRRALAHGPAARDALARVQRLIDSLATQGH
ncbi:MAG: tetratricopeptide repeat protein [Planctomycetes bacterium]|nr:tetratricopeptide repeat protein [Planctomycetota bacterium]MBI3845175.1 tetratricopeptide repeat protein [Planctomycetota bacterium]